MPVVVFKNQVQPNRLVFTYAETQKHNLNTTQLTY